MSERGWDKGGRSIHEGPVSMGAPEKEAKPTEREGVPDPKSPEVRKQIRERAKVRAQLFLDAYADTLRAMAGEPKLKFKVGDGFYIDYASGTICVNAEYFEEQGDFVMTQKELLFVTSHEMSHYYDIKMNPKAMFEHFDVMQRQAHALVSKAKEILIAKHGEPLPEYLDQIVSIGSDGREVTQLEAFIYRHVARFYNALDDMFVNENLPQRSPRYNPNMKHNDVQVVHDLYRDKAFPTDHKKPRGTPPEEGQPADMRDGSLSGQFGDYLLRRKMVPDQEVLVSDEVRAELDGFRDRFSEKAGRTLKEDVQMATTWANKRARDPGTRYPMLHEVAEPAFLRLFFKDLEEMPLPPEQKGDGQGEGEKKGEKEGEGAEGGEKGKGKDEKEGQGRQAPPGLGPVKPPEGGGKQGKEKQQPGKKGEGEPKPGQGGSGRTWKEDPTNPEPFDRGVVEKYMKDKAAKDAAEKAAAENKKNEARKTPAQRIAEAEDRNDRALAERNDVPPELADEYNKIAREIWDHRLALMEVFERSMWTIQQSIAKGWERGFQSGKFKVSEFLRKYAPELATERMELIPWQELTAYLRKEFESRITLKPDSFRVRLVIDGSGSMGGEKMEQSKRLAILFLESLSTFEATINSRFQLKNPVRVECEITMFGSNGAAKIVKPFGTGSSSDSERVNRFKALGEMDAKYGGTCDAEALWDVAADISPEQTKKLKKNEAKEIVFEITDGEPNQASRRYKPREDLKWSPGSIVTEDKDGNVTDQEGDRNEQLFDAAMQDTWTARHAIAEKGVIFRAVQIAPSGHISRGELEKFDAVFPKGVGGRVEDVSQLPIVVGGMLAEEIGRVQFDVDMEEE